MHAQQVIGRPCCKFAQKCRLFIVLVQTWRRRGAACAGCTWQSPSSLGYHRCCCSPTALGCRPGCSGPGWAGVGCPDCTRSDRAFRRIAPLHKTDKNCNMEQRQIKTRQLVSNAVTLLAGVKLLNAVQPIGSRQTWYTALFVPHWLA